MFSLREALRSLLSAGDYEEFVDLREWVLKRCFLSSCVIKSALFFIFCPAPEYLVAVIALLVQALLMV